MQGLINRVIHHLLIILLILVSALCLLFSYRLFNPESCVTLIIFNVFFVTLFFQLRGKLLTKTALLTTGNTIGLLWNYLFQEISSTGSDLLGPSSTVFFSLAYPILTLLWIVPFWSLSLSCLPKFLKEKPPR